MIATGIYSSVGAAQRKKQLFEFNILGNLIPTAPNTADETLPVTSVTLGTKFRSSVAGTIVGARYYKAPSATGTHTAYLWSSAGALLTSQAFTNETASGWQEQRFTTPYAILANTTYVIGYFGPATFYATSPNFFNNQAYINGVLTAQASVTGNLNGVFKYGGSVTFPDESFNHTNYFADVIFQQ